LKYPKLISGGIHNDTRGTVKFMNDFDMSEVKRCYQITNSHIGSTRGWQGHKIEQKWFYVTHGVFKLYLVKIDSWSNPSSDLKVFEYYMNGNHPEVLYVPEGYANLIQMLSENAQLLVYSSLTLEDAKNDQIRFPLNEWNFKKNIIE